MVLGLRISMVPYLVAPFMGFLVLVSAQTNNINNNNGDTIQSNHGSQRSELEDPHQPQTIQLSSDHVLYDFSQFPDDEFVASAVSPFCKSFSSLCHIRCLQRRDSKNPVNVNESLSPEQRARSRDKGSDVNRCNHISGTNKIQVLCLCNNGVELTVEVDYSLEGVFDIKDAGRDRSGIGEAGLIHQAAYPGTKMKTTTPETVTVTLSNSPDTPVGLLSQNSKGLKKSESGQTFFARRGDIHREEQRGCAKDYANINPGNSVEISERSVKEVRSSSNNRSPMNMSLRRHSDDDDEDEDDDDDDDDEDDDDDDDDEGDDGHDDNDQHPDSSGRNAIPRHRGHRVDYEPMYPPFDIEAEPSYKHSNHKNDHDDDEKKHRVKDRDQSE